ncbi:MAG: AraC family transcriptional regulator [Spirochaetes bacterium]|nr:AraC family transcriptional regulator [Spirochaetota bacterium]
MDILDFIVTIGACTIIIISIGQLAVRRKKAVNYFCFGFYFLNGFVILTYVANQTGFVRQFPHLLFVHFPVEMLIGAVGYFYGRALVEGRVRFTYRNILLFLPFIVSLITLLPFFLMNGATKLAVYQSYFAGNQFLRFMYYPLFYAELWITFCTVLFITRLYSILREKTIRFLRQIRLIMFFTVCCFAFLLFVFFLDLYEAESLYRISEIIWCLLFIMLFFISNRYPEFFNKLRKEASRVKYRRSKIAGIDVRAVVERISELMEYERIYEDDGLTLRQLSAIMEVTPHQLSEILNKDMSTSFKSYVNAHRIEAAKRMLIDRPDASILQIAYECGFNSKTTFNTTFVKLTGITPSDFRSENH